MVKEKAPQVKGDDAETLILNYLQTMNRPYNATSISSNLRSVSKGVTDKALQTLIEKNLIISKTYGKQVIVCTKQEGLPAPDPTELKSKKTQSDEYKQEGIKLKDEIKRKNILLSSLKSQPKTDSLKGKIEKSINTCEEMRTKASKLRNDSSTLSSSSSSSTTTTTKPLQISSSILTHQTASLQKCKKLYTSRKKLCLGVLKDLGKDWGDGEVREEVGLEEEGEVDIDDGGEGGNGNDDGTGATYSTPSSSSSPKEEITNNKRGKKRKLSELVLDLDKIEKEEERLAKLKRIEERKKATGIGIGAAGVAGGEKKTLGVGLGNGVGAGKLGGKIKAGGKTEIGATEDKDDNNKSIGTSTTMKKIPAKATKPTSSTAAEKKKKASTTSAKASGFKTTTGSKNPKLEAEGENGEDDGSDQPDDDRLPPPPKKKQKKNPSPIQTTTTTNSTNNSLEDDKMVDGITMTTTTTAVETKKPKKIPTTAKAGTGAGSVSKSKMDTKTTANSQSASSSPPEPLGPPGTAGNEQAMNKNGDRDRDALLSKTMMEVDG